MNSKEMKLPLAIHLNNISSPHVYGRTTATNTTSTTNVKR